MFRRLDRNDINVVMVGGAIISLFNILDVDRLGRETGVPVIAITFEASPGIEPHLRRAFPSGWQAKVRAYRKLGRRVALRLKTGKRVFVRYHGMTRAEAHRLVDKFTIQGAVPEPIRLAKLVARARLDEEP
jgi:hypothetical protein